MDARRLKLLLALLAALATGALLGYALSPRPAPGRPDAEAIAVSTLVSVREQGRITPFSARFASIATASESRLGLTARKTLIMPGTVRYGVDLARLKRSDLAWDQGTKTLTLTLPPLELSGPAVQLNDLQEYSEGGVVMALTDAERTLDSANRREAQDDLMRQARAPAMLQSARNEAMRIVARAFALPLRAAGVEATVAVRSLGPSGAEEAVFLDRPRRLEGRLSDRAAGR
ncbi:MAG: DUF4230 domain-containing protein [Allosphingosinicella sp.]